MKKGSWDSQHETENCSNSSLFQGNVWGAMLFLTQSLPFHQDLLWMQVLCSEKLSEMRGCIQCCSSAGTTDCCAPNRAPSSFPVPCADLKSALSGLGALWSRFWVHATEEAPLHQRNTMQKDTGYNPRPGRMACIVRYENDSVFSWKSECVNNLQGTKEGQSPSLNISFDPLLSFWSNRFIV